MLLSKGLEVEVYTGTATGQIVGLSDRIVKDLNGFVREPDSRNVEYTTAPYCGYERLLCAILKPRQHLRQYLRELGNYTLVPGSTLALGDSQVFHRSDPQNPYHSYIENTYGTQVVTASIHINIGIEDVETLIKACRLVRVEAPLFLALSASSPFLDGKTTGYHSTRWHTFPKTPATVPLFLSHHHFIEWTEEQLRLGTMQNVRHLWSSVRPNGDRRPYNLNRLELRICDLVMNPIELLAIIALLEARLWKMFATPHLDPLRCSQLSPLELLTLSDRNEMRVAAHSLEAELEHWQDGRKITAKQWIAELYEEVYPFAKSRGFACFLNPVQRILRQGNQAQRWLAHHPSQDVAQIITEAIAQSAQEEQELETMICPEI